MPLKEKSELESKIEESLETKVRNIERTITELMAIKRKGRLWVDPRSSESAGWAILTFSIEYQIVDKFLHIVRTSHWLR